MNRETAFALFEERAQEVRGDTVRLIHGCKWNREPDAYQVRASSQRVEILAYWLDKSSPFPSWATAESVVLEEVRCVTCAE